MSAEDEGPVREDEEAAPETSDTATTTEVPVPPAPESVVPSPDEEPVAEAPQDEPAAAPAAPPAVEATPVETPDDLAKADVGKRVVAALIDFGIAFMMGLVPGVGQLLGAAYLILRDGLELDFMSHRSLGKNVMKLHLVSVDGEPLDLMTSVRRNWIFGIGPLVPLLFIIPILGWLMIPFALFAAIALGITELVLALTDAEGRRLGDKWANTMLVED